VLEEQDQEIPTTEGPAPPTAPKDLYKSQMVTQVEAIVVDHLNEDAFSGDMQSHVLPVTSNTGCSVRTDSTLSDLYFEVRSSRPRERTDVQPVPLYLAAELAREGTRESATQHCTAPPGQLHQFGVAWTLPLILSAFPSIVSSHCSTLALF
jgi:hypothetical protein